MVPRLPKNFTHPMCIGKGAFASVYRARQTGLDRWVAIKILLEKDIAKRRELLREAKVQAHISLTSIPQVYDAFEWKQNVCIVMEWVKGISLASLLETPLSHSDRLYCARHFIEALASLHALGYAHRDIKPANVLVSSESGIYFVDFGFTKNIVDGNASVAFVAKGTPAYMAPEIWEKGSNVDLFRADVFSAGKVLAQILDGEPVAAFAKKLVEPQPHKRPSSGKEVLARWRELPEANEITPEYRLPCAAAIASRRLAEELVQAAKHLLYARRGDEAYWLLVEALGENPEHAEAVRLMSDNAHFIKKPRVGAGARYAAATAAALVIATAAFFAGRKSGDGIPTDPQADHHSRIIASDVKRHGETAPVSKTIDILLKEDTGKSDKLSGRLAVELPDGDGGLFIDGAPAGDPLPLSKGIDIAYGRHALQWRDPGGGVRWKERVTVLPFQTKVVVVPQQARMTQ